MKTYPSILYPPVCGLGEWLHTFAKLDGSNLRFEWSRKRGWYKAGTRHRLLDTTDEIFGPALSWFLNRLGDDLASICGRERWQRAVIFCEWWGPQSFAGLHRAGDTMQLTVIDAAPYKKGLLPPKEFLELFGRFGPEYLGLIKWNKDFVDRVRRGEVGGASAEGVVGKATRGRKPLLYKAKTQWWRDEVRKRYPQEADKILDS